MAGATGLEPATSGVTGQRCNQLYYAPAAGEVSNRGDGILQVSMRNFFFQKFSEFPTILEGQQKAERQKS